MMAVVGNNGYRFTDGLTLSMTLVRRSINVGDAAAELIITGDRVTIDSGGGVVVEETTGGGSCV